jgi:hypothetical protein
VLSLILAAVLAEAPTPRAIAADPDVRCYAVMTFAISGLAESDDAKAEELVGVTALAWYYYGKMQVKFPDTDFAPGLVELTATPGYVSGLLQEDAARCGADGEREGREMQALGERMQQMAPIAEQPVS